jgi:hypothetical protein
MIERRMNEPSSPLVIRMQCRKCGETLSSTMTQLITADQISLVDSSPLLPSGYWMKSELITSEELFYGVGPKEAFINMSDLINVTAGGVRNGCCGPDGMDGANLLCKCGTPIGTEYGDCWMPHFVSVPLDGVELRPAFKEE